MKTYGKNKLRTKTLSVVLSVCMMISSVALVTANAAEADGSLSTAQINPYMYESGSADFSDEFITYIVGQIRSYSDSISLKGYNIKADDMEQLLLKILFENPDIFYIDPSQLPYSADARGNVAVIKPVYLYDKAAIPSKITEFENAADKLIAEVQSDWSQADKALITHDNIALRCEYAPDDMIYDNTNKEIYTAYGCLVNQVAVCQGYSLAYNYLLGKIGIKASIVNSSAMNHAWSMAEIDGKHYHIDVTWDDPIYDKLGQVYHRYFLQSDQGMLNDDSYSRHYDWTAKYTAADTTYDEYFWSDINTKIPYMDGNYYFISNLSGHPFKDNLVKYNGSESVPILNIGEKWAANESGTSFWGNNFAFLAVYGNRFYYNTADKIYSVNFDGSDKQLVYSVTPEQSKIGDIYGMALKDDGYLYISLSGNPNSAVQNEKTVLADTVLTEPVTTEPPTTEPPTTDPPTTEPPTTEPPATEPPTTDPPATEPPTTDPPTTEPPTTEPPTTGPPVITIEGDVNGDGELNVKDAAAIQLKLARLYTGVYIESAADINGDGEINVKDAAYIQLKLAKLL